jgi:hypothetical protein
MDPEELGTSKKHEGQPLIQVQEESNSCGTKGCWFGPIIDLIGMFFLMLQG